MRVADIRDACTAVQRVGDDPRLRAGVRLGVLPERVAMAIATSAIEIRSPDDSSMSAPRWGRCVISMPDAQSSVVSPIADTTATTRRPDSVVATSVGDTAYAVGVADRCTAELWTTISTAASVAACVARDPRATETRDAEPRIRALAADSDAHLVGEH